MIQLLVPTQLLQKSEQKVDNLVSPSATRIFGPTAILENNKSKKYRSHNAEIAPFILDVIFRFLFLNVTQVVVKLLIFFVILININGVLMNFSKLNNQIEFICLTHLLLKFCDHFFKVFVCNHQFC